jgi:uncharacterized membrane protein YqaE (UPF0057 family)
LEDPTVLTMLAILCPPLAVLATGRPGRATVNLGLTALLYVPGVIHALQVVDQYNTERWSEAYMRAVAQCETV